MDLISHYHRHVGKIIVFHILAFLVSLWSYKEILPLLPLFLYPLTLITPGMIFLYMMFLCVIYLAKKPFPLFTYFLFLMMFTFGLTGIVFFPTYLIDQGFTWWRFQNVVGHFLFGLQTIIVWQSIERISWWKQSVAVGICAYIIYLFFTWKTSPYFYSDYPWMIVIEFIAFGSVLLAFFFVNQRLKNRAFPY